MSKLSEALEELADALDARDEAVSELEDLENEVAADHEGTHSGSFRWCERAACRSINRRGEP
jgi:hypothetical protein